MGSKWIRRAWCCLFDHGSFSVTVTVTISVVLVQLPEQYAWPFVSYRDRDRYSDSCPATWPLLWPVFSYTTQWPLLWLLFSCMTVPLTRVELNHRYCDFCSATWPLLGVLWPLLLPWLLHPTKRGPYSEHETHFIPDWSKSKINLCNAHAHKMTLL